MGLFKDGARMFPYAAMMAGAISLASYSAYSIAYDKAVETGYEEANNYSHENYPELYENYEEYVNKIGEALKECNEERKVVRDFAFYVTMLENGCISYGREFGGDVLPIEFGDALGATIANGSGVCRHAADNLADVLSSMGYDAKVVVGMSYNEGDKKPTSANHAVVYVVEDGTGYLLDPINGTILLKKFGLLYYDMRSQEDTYVCFEPEMSYNALNDSDANNTELLFNLGNDFKKHWEILKEYSGYLDGAKDYLLYFYLYETKELLQNEENIKVIFDGIMEEYNKQNVEEPQSVKKR